MTACWKLGIEDVTAGEMGVPLSDVPIVRSYPSYSPYFENRVSHIEPKVMKYPDVKGKVSKENNKGNLQGKATL